MIKRRAASAWLLVVAGAIVAAGAIPLPAAADTSQNLALQLSPLPIELNAVPGNSVSTSLRVRNTGPTPETLKVTLEAVSQSGATGQIGLHDFAAGDPLPGWVHFSQPVFTAPAGVWESITMTVNLPKTAAYGYYYAVQFQLANAAKPQPGQTGVQGAADVFVLLNAEAPGETSKAAVTSFVAAHKTFEFLPATFDIYVHNSGNIHIAPHGDIFIQRGSTQVGSLAVNASGGAILPGSNRLFTAQWQDGFPVYKPVLDANGQSVSNGKGGAKQRLVWNFNDVTKLRFGRYTAHLLMVYNDGHRDVPLNASVSFWVVPWRLLAVAAVIILLVLLGLWSLVSRFRRPKNRPPHKTWHA